MQQQMIDWYVGNGYKLMSDVMPAIGERFQAARLCAIEGSVR